MDVNKLSPHEIDALEALLRARRQAEEAKRLEAERLSGPRSWKFSAYLCVRRGVWPTLNYSGTTGHDEG
jgi:hypothetical protein